MSEPGTQAFSQPKLPDEIEQRTQAVVQKWLDTIPPADRAMIKDPKQIRSVLNLSKSAEAPGESHLFQIEDKIGDMPDSAAVAMREKDPTKMAEAFERFANDPVKVSEETDKVKNIAKSTLPESLRKAVLSIILTEGERSAVGAFREYATALRSQNTVTPTFNRELYSFQTDETARADMKLRQAATLRLLEGLYSELMKDPLMVVYRVMARQTRESKSNPRNVADMAKKFQEVTGDKAFEEFSDAATVESVVAEKEKGETPGSVLYDVVNQIDRKLMKAIEAKFVSSAVV